MPVRPAAQSRPLTHRPVRTGAVSVALLGAVAVVGACSGGPSTVVRPPSSPPTGTTSATSTPTTPPPSHQSLRVIPARNLAARQQVRLVATGFTAGEALVVTECAAKGKQTGPGDCNLSGLLSVQADSSGAVRVRFTVFKGPFGANHVVCRKRQPCLVSVTQATLSPTEEADAPIAFR